MEFSFFYPRTKFGVFIYKDQFFLFIRPVRR